MKITDLKIQLLEFESRIAELTEVSDSKKGSRFIHRIGDDPMPWRIPLIRLTTDGGIEGHSSATWWVGEEAHLKALIAVYKPLLIGENPMNRERIWRKLWKANRLFNVPKTYLGPIDVALWDIVGKATGQPVYKLLGGYRTRVRAYANSGHCSSAEEYVSALMDAMDRGYTAYKLTCPFPPEDAIPICEAIRAAAGGDMDLMYDAVESLDYLEALRLGRELERLGYRWYEEPVQDFEIRNLVRLREALGIPICANENLEGSHYLSAEYILRGAADIIRSDVRLKGGITGVAKTAHVCESFGLNCEVHTTHNPILDIANLHAICGIHNCDYYEVWSGDWQSIGVSNPPQLGADGYVDVPRGSGLGLDLNQAQIDDITVGEL